MTRARIIRCIPRSSPPCRPICAWWPIIWGVARLGDASVEALFANLQDIRAALGDGRVMRALHYFDEVARVDRQREALEEGDFPLFLKCVRLSGASSAQFLQNVSPRDAGSEERQPAMLIRAVQRTCSAKRAPGASTAVASADRCWRSCPSARSPALWRRWDGLLGYRACREVVVGGPGVLARRLP